MGRHHPLPATPWLVLLVAGWLLVGAPAVVLAEGSPADQDREGALSISTARVDDHPEVSLTVNAPLTLIDDDLPPDAFTLLEDGEERQVEAERLASEELAVALSMDTSGSMEGAPLAAAQQAARQFSDLLPAPVTISVIEFNTEVEVRSDFTTDRATTETALDELDAGGWTSLYDALHHALDLFEERDPPRRSIVVLSDGGDNRSDASLESTVQRLGEGDEVLHIVELITVDRPVPRERFGRDDPDADEVDLEALGSLASAAGQGAVVAPEDLDGLQEVYQEIASTLMNQYELTYTSQAHGTTRVEVRFEHDGVVVEDGRDIDLPAEPEAAPEPPPVDEEEPDEVAVPVDPGRDEPGAVMEFLTQPWVRDAALVVFVVGLLASIYLFRFGPLRP